MSPPPSPTPEQWAKLDDYTRLVFLQQRDTDPGRRQVTASHLAIIGPYAGAGADGPAAALIAQHYQAEAAQLAGEPVTAAQSGDSSFPAREGGEPWR